MVSEESLYDMVFIEDNEDHAALIAATLRRADLNCSLRFFCDGESALSHLANEENKRPLVVFLDLNLPGISGLQCLEVIKGDRRLRDTPVIILSTSSAEQDKTLAYEHRANSYLVKPIDFAQLRSMIEAAGAYWSRWNQPAFEKGDLA